MLGDCKWLIKYSCAKNVTAKFGFRILQNDVTNPCLWNASNYIIGAASFFIAVGKKKQILFPSGIKKCPVHAPCRMCNWGCQWRTRRMSEKWEQLYRWKVICLHTLNITPNELTINPKWIVTSDRHQIIKYSQVQQFRSVYPKPTPKILRQQVHIDHEMHTNFRSPKHRNYKPSYLFSYDCPNNVFFSAWNPLDLAKRKCVNLTSLITLTSAQRLFCRFWVDLPLAVLDMLQGC